MVFFLLRHLTLAPGQKQLWISLEKQTNRKISLGNNYGKCYKGNRERVGVILDSSLSNAPNTRSSDPKALLSKYVPTLSTSLPSPSDDSFLQLPLALSLKLKLLVPLSKALPSYSAVFFSNSHLLPSLRVQSSSFYSSYI